MKLTQVVSLAEVAQAQPDANQANLQNSYWVQTLKSGNFSHWLYGDIPLDTSRLQRFADNFKNGTYGQDLAINFEHGQDQAKGLQAAGWVKDVKIGPDGMSWLIQFTEDAIAEIKAGKWRYFSAEFLDEWTSDTGTTHQDILVGGALTNHPFLKGMQPLNFSELVELAVWSTSYMNDLPDSAFLYVEAGGKKDASGKTTPRSLRHFPVKDSNGNVDIVHVRNALARIPQSNLPDTVKVEAQKKARSLLEHKQSAPVGEHAPEEHADPEHATVIPPEEADAQTGSRRDTPPIVEETENNGEEVNPMDRAQLVMFAEKLGITVTDEMSDEQLVSDVDKAITETASLRQAVQEAESVKTFREQYPEEYKRMNELQEKSRKADAKEFSETYRAFTDPEGNPTGQGLSSLAVEKIAGAHIKLSEGVMTHADLSDLLDTIKVGVVKLSENGSSREAQVKKFSEYCKEIQLEDENLSWKDVVAKAATKYPEAYSEYQKNPSKN